jgi:hypothetical protein
VDRGILSLGRKHCRLLGEALGFVLDGRAQQLAMIEGGIVEALLA